MKLFLPLLLLLSCSSAPASPFDEAESLANTQKQGRVRDLYREAAKSDPDPQRREKAAIRAAQLEWRVFRNAAAARQLLGTLDTSDAWLEQARVSLELERNYAAARASVQKALAAAKTNEDRRAANTGLAIINVEERRELPRAIALLEQTIAEAGPRIETSRLLLKAAILANDDATALRALRWYYADVPSLVPDSVPDRRALGRALANARLYEEAALILTDDAELVAYAKVLERLRAICDDHFRKAATGEESMRAFRKAVLATIPKDAQARFGAVYTIGQTDNVGGMHYGHRVLDERRSVEQYGQKGMVRFVLLDNMIANGFMAWIRDNHTGTGGWNEKETIYQVRPMYANSPVRAWMRLHDPERRAKDDREIADQTRRKSLLGVALRMERQYLETLPKERDAFIERYRREEFDHSIWAHEGRHAIDHAVYKIENSEELEYRAKLSEIVFAASPRLAFADGILSTVGDTPHGRANKRVLDGIQRVTKLGALTDLDKLTDEQLRAAARSLDPMAK
ncbi:MAG TPA: hypothetical protein VND45_12535 [Thermoanaerobaculia bacterium]|nr:hypothetical protein [Thermoanaerobaculia bacterium]